MPSPSEYMIASARRNIARSPGLPGSCSKMPSFSDSGQITTPGYP